METRVLGKTGLKFSVLSFGCGAVGGLMVKGTAADQERAVARATGQEGSARFDLKRRQAQIAARHALQQIAAGVQARGATLAAIHAAELQLPEAWIPFVVSR